MVLRGSQFQRFGPARCVLLTSRALSSYIPYSPWGQLCAVSLQYTSGMARGQLCDSRRRAVLGTYEGLALHGASRLRMSWTYWGIIIGLAALVVMLIACIRMLSSNGNEDRQGSKQEAGGASDANPEPPSIRRAA